jgi:hypothetical protein
MILKKFSLPETVRAVIPPAAGTSEQQKKKKSVIEQHLIANHMKVIQKTDLEDSSLNQIRILLNGIAENIMECEALFLMLRKAISDSKGKFAYSLNGLTKPQRKAAEQMLTLFKLCGMFSELHLLNGCLYSGQISSALRVQQFLNGIWLEQYVQLLGSHMIKEKSAALNLPYEIYSNMKLEDQQGTQHEIDLIFSIGEQVFASEQKSGISFCDYDKYRSLANWLHLWPDHFLLVNAAITNMEFINCIMYFHQIYIANIELFGERFLDMIDKAFERKE